MIPPDLHAVRAINPAVRRYLEGQQLELAIQAASDQFADALCDLAVAEVACGRADSAIEKLRSALDLKPDSPAVFHNLMATLLAQARLRGPELDLQVEYIRHNLNRYPWLERYRRLIYMPVFLNLKFVAGKCNLACRMCCGRNDPSYPDRLSFLSAEDLDRFLAAAPTVAGLTLSSGDSDPMLHPQLKRIIDVARRHQTTLDFYTNGHPLNERKCRAIVDAQIVKMINFSVDAATPETYQHIRGESLTRLIAKIEMLQAIKRQRGDAYPFPWVSMSFVAMADNIHELPAFVDLAARLGARRVLVEDLGGWEEGAGGNQSATNDPQCHAYIAEARRRATDAGLELALPGRLRRAPTSTVTGPASMAVEAASPVESDLVRVPDAADDEPAARLACCGWIRGIWVEMDGRIEPCCLVHNVADMGNVHDGPLFANDKYARVKDLLLAGKVFGRCVNQRQCQYVQQQRAAGIPFRIITREELGELRPESPPRHGGRTLVPLTVIGVE